jgi:hypothetical protein
MMRKGNIALFVKAGTTVGSTILVEGRQFVIRNNQAGIVCVMES